MKLPAFWSYQDHKEIPFLLKMRSEWQEAKPLAGMRILNNTPLTLDTLCKVDVLLQAGAIVTLTRTKSIRPISEEKTYPYISALGIEYIPEHDMLQGRDNEFDFILDCSAEIANIIKPRKGIIELTQSGTQIYRNFETHVPIISVDDSKLKNLETFLGTAEGFLRAFKTFSPHPVTQGPVVIFGYGKVGSGVTDSLLKETKEITVIDSSPKALEVAKARGLKAISFFEKLEVEEAISEALTIITASGVKNLISDNYSSSLFKGKVLANVGAEDEFGPSFSEEQVLANKQPLNFSLPNPTKMRYLDPIFYAHNLGCQIILDQQLEPGYYPLSPEIDAQILQAWQKHYPEEDLSVLGFPTLLAA
jgi:adenosylhomocysteinase